MMIQVYTICAARITLTFWKNWKKKSLPIMMPLLTVIGPIICGIPMMLFMTKVKKFGMVTIMGVLIGVYLWITGMGFWPAVFGLVCGLITDLLDKSGNYQSAAKTVIGNDIFHILYFGNFLPIYLDEDFVTVQYIGRTETESSHCVCYFSR